MAVLNKADRRIAEQRVGKAYRGPDGIVRWVINLSDRGYYHMRWLDEEKGIWHIGGHVHSRFWADYDGPEMPAPQPGEPYKFCNAMGFVQEW